MTRPQHPRGIAFAAAAALIAISAKAGSLDDLTFRWDNTIDLSTQYLLHNAEPAGTSYCAYYAAASAILDHTSEGSCQYAAGFRTGRLDFLSQIDVVDGDFGLHASADAWYDAVDNNSARSRSNEIQRVADVSEHGGQDIELFEAFLHGVVDLGDDRPLSFRIGRHTIIWGESLFFPENGVAAGLAPVDTYIVQNITDYRSREVYLPVNQLSLSWAVTSDITIEAYDQFEWRRSRIDPEYAYVDPNNVLGAEGTHLIGLSFPGRGTFYYSRAADRTPNASDEFGLAVKLRRGDFDIGFYALSYDSKTPNVYFYPSAFRAGQYRLDYAKGIEIFGASLAGSLDGGVFAVELSGRRNMPLVNGGIFVRPLASGASNPALGPFIPLGDTVHANLSWEYTLPPLSALPDGATWRSEIAFNHLIDTTSNAANLSPGRTHTAAAFRTVFEPQFLQLLPRIDVTTPVGLGYNFLGLSETDASMDRGTGDVSIGVTATLDRTWKSALTFTHYFGRSKYAASGYPGPQQQLSDWDYIELSVERSF